MTLLRVRMRFRSNNGVDCMTFLLLKAVQVSGPARWLGAFILRFLPEGCEQSDMAFPPVRRGRGADLL